MSLTVGREIMEFYEDISEVQSIQLVADKFLERMKEFKFDRYSIVFFPKTQFDINENIVCSNLSVDFFKKYHSENYFQIDPIVKAIRNSPNTFRWSDYVSQQRTFSEESCRLMQLRRDFGHADGYTIPVHNQHELPCGVSVCGFAPDFTSRSKNAALTMGMFVYQRISSLHAVKKPSVQILTDRERDVLSYAAMGFSDGRIAKKLSLSIHTVDSYMRTAKRKLDAHSRTEAVVKAIQVNAISI